MILELSNDGRTVKIKIGNIHLQYLGPKNLIRFKKITDVSGGCISVDTEFSNDGVVEVEEDYIDLGDILSKYDYDVNKVFDSITGYRIVERRHHKMKKKITCDELITKSLMIFDSIAMFPKEGTAGDMQMLCISLARPNNRTLIRLEDVEVLESNMRNAMIERLVCDVKKNKEMIEEQAAEVLSNAKVCRR